MANAVPRLRMLAGPNGSGKSFLVSALQDAVNLGVSVNADEIEATLKAQASATRRQLALADWNLQLTSQELHDFLVSAQSQRLTTWQRARIRVENNTLLFSGLRTDSYLAAWAAELIRYHLLAAHQTLTFETVMSHPSKLEFLRDARQQGYRTYLYYVATDDPKINMARVRSRVKRGGHPVSKAKIVDRYFRSLGLLFEAVKLVDRAYLFDNSSHEPVLIAEITDGRHVKYQTNVLPAWVVNSFHTKMLQQATE